MDLKVIETVQKFTWNYDAVKQSLEEHIKDYAGLVVNEENLPSMEKTQKEIASLRVKLTKFRTEVKKELDKPYLNFEVQLKELLRLVESAETPIKEQIEKYEIKRRDEKAVQVQQLINDISAELGLEEKYSSQIAIADKYLNRTQKPSDTKTDIQMKVAWYLDIQNKEKEAEQFRQQKIEMAKFMCESLSAGLATPLTFAEIENRIESLDIAGLKAHIEREVSRRKEQEERAAQQALERAERIRQDAERKALVEQEAAARIAVEKERQSAIEQESPKNIKETPVSQSSNPVNSVVKNDSPKEKSYNAQFVLYGTSQATIMTVKEFLESNEIEFNLGVKEVL